MFSSSPKLQKKNDKTGKPVAKPKPKLVEKLTVGNRIRAFSLGKSPKPTQKQETIDDYFKAEPDEFEDQPEYHVLEEDTSQFQRYAPEPFKLEKYDSARFNFGNKPEVYVDMKQTLSSKGEEEEYLCPEEMQSSRDDSSEIYEEIDDSSELYEEVDTDVMYHVLGRSLSTENL